MEEDIRGFYDPEVVVFNGILVRYEVIKDLIKETDTIRSATEKEFIKYIKDR